jgi:hypothetical protein
MFTIHKVRLGLATNSSSTHSLIILPGGASDDSAGDDGEFGWNYFTAGSTERKARYAACQLRSAMARVASPDVADAVAEKWTGVSLAPADDYADYVDHQSTWTLPLDWEGRSVDKEFFDELMEFLMRDDVVVLGGNDNDEVDHPLDDGTAHQLAVPIEEYRHAGDLVCRKDDGHWVIFNRGTGTKIRMSFGEGDHVEPEKARTPELVDVKITDFCPYGCEFCYQDSTTKGEHAPKGRLYKLAHAMKEMRVFEVAIGGGEPTLHPDFVEILQNFRSHGIVPNFTTKNLGWLHDHAVRPKVLEAAGAFAYSVEHARDVERLASIRDVYEIPSAQLNCQYVMGSSFLEDFRHILETSKERGIRVTLLGYKTDGRGSQFEPKDYADWPTVLKEVHEASGYGLRVGIDTALAREFQSQLGDLGVPKWCYEVVEGKFSMYVDGVAWKSARSSYGSSLAMRPLQSVEGHGWYGKLAGEITEHFARY